MFKNYLLILYRNLLRQKMYTAINILGLSIGLTGCILIGLYVVNELSYDKYHKNHDRIYRVVFSGKFGTTEINGPVSPAPLAETLLREIPEVEKVFRLRNIGDQPIIYDNKLYYQNRFLFADSTFLTEFQVTFLKGNPKKALTRPFTLVITREMAEKYFGGENPIGKTVFMKNWNMDFEITGLIENLPTNTHIRFSFLASMNSLLDSKSQFWLSDNYFTYVLLKQGTNAKKFDEKLNNLMYKHCAPDLQKFTNSSIDEFLKAGNKINYYLEKMDDVHLRSPFKIQLGLEDNGDIANVYIFIAVAIFILIIACVNFINLATARSSNRAKEVGLRKVFGSDKKQLISQFLSESLILSLFSIVLAVSLVELMLPMFNSLLDLKLSLSNINPFYLYGALMLLTVIVSFLAGFYPSVYLSAFRPAEVLKGKLKTGASGSWLRNILVVFQFTIGIFILLCTFLISKQLSYIQHRKLGYDKENLVVVDRTSPIKNQIKVFMEELRTNPNIEDLSLSDAIPGRMYDNNGLMVEGLPMNDLKLFTTFSADYTYVSTMGIKMTQGRYFSQDFPTDTAGVVINQTGLRILGIKDPLGKRILFPERDKKVPLTIIGVMEDFNYESLHRPINPILIRYNPGNYDGYITLRIQKDKTSEVLDYINKTWKKYTEAAPLNYFFFDQEFKQMYNTEFRTRKVMTVFTILGIITACLGLLGLIAFTSERRTKEIGVRKALGSSTFNLIVVLSSESLKLVLISAFLASAFAYFAIVKWLQTFAFRMKIEWKVFLFATLLALLIALITVIFITIRAARKNPVEALRFE